MTQGDVYWYTFKEPDKRRPVLILTRDSAIHFLTSPTVAPITTTIRGIPTEVVLGQADGLFADCAVNLDNIQTVQREKVGAFITHLSLHRMRAVRKAIEFALGFDALQ
ncbi:type II toxin-antitoxin system PemK/MazF family toxin [Desulforhabdus sp. TSK]|uniref:type II toxin-antitoxin system PemK/MazF family toxin n=1 Tax=Desulforhabdus sp. TSK TaxID=2925014 RepID=UPI001FC8E701|nr:type II toxin-antitoxin system PemK/MazF family toxin [Desulforhabdus sp. TSK]